ncbi:MAG: sensor domain-containing diguanylate cyclase [Proteobacteria bacterium]|nr:sensor domain-containing diguanylate cyclase [Pseudomonadota bacterium]
MSFLRNRFTRWLHARIRSSIVTRTTLAILALSLVLGLSFASIVSTSVERREQQRGEMQLQQLLSTIERTAQIACYLNDRTLAAEIAQGLMRNRAVSGVSIVSGKTALVRVGKNAAPHQGRANNSTITRPIYSPFDAQDRVGELTLFVDRAAIHVEAASDSRDSTLAMGLQAALVAVGVALAVYIFSTRPIKAVSTELHRIRNERGARLRVPANNRYDEVGTLVTDVNSLIANLEDLVTTERQLRIAHEIGERKLRLIVEKAETGLFVMDDRGVLESWNPAFVRLLHLTPEQMPHSGVTQLQQLLGSHGARLNQLLNQCLNTGQPYDLDLDVSAAGGARSVWIEVTLNPIGPNALRGVVNDITERKQNELSAQELASQDTLTGLLNRRGLDARLGAVFFMPLPETSSQLALLQIDLDRFKEVNDGHGHESGDRVLRHVSRILERNVRRGDLIARPGGDEFVVVLVGITDRSKAEEIASAIIADIQRPIDIGSHHVHIGASVGIAFANGAGDSPEALARRADSAMYVAKRAGRGQVSFAPEPIPTQTNAVA